MRDPDGEIPEGIRSHIERRLREVERKHGVEVLFAIESGSRAWGFASPDSDYDVRFVYRHPREWYLALREGRDVIECGIDEHEVDLAGWDLRKALRLLLKWNPALHEWLVSPITYRQAGCCRAEMLVLYDTHADLRAIGHHYLGIASGEWKRMEDDEDVRLKKYFYVIRPLMALHWLRTRASVPPMNFAALRDAAPWPDAMNAAVDDLIAVKRATPELGLGRRVETIDVWVAETFDGADPASLAAPGDAAAARAAADALFLRTLQEKDSQIGA